MPLSFLGFATVRAKAVMPRITSGTKANATKPEGLVARADALDYFGNCAINLDGSVLLKSGAIPYRIESYKVLDGPNPTGHAVWWYLDYGDWGITTFCFAPGAGG